MDWANLIADQERILTTHYTKGRGGNSISKVIIHHNGGNLSVAGCYNVWQARAASAHYQVCSDGTVGQLVWDANTAWHAGNWQANQTSIGIEHADCQSNPWRISDTCLDQGAHLVAAVCIKYGLGRPEWGRNLYGHSDFAATECPASLAVGGSQHSEYVARAQSWYDTMTGATASVSTERAAAVQLYDGNATDAQRWQVQHVGTDYVTLTSVSCGLALDVAGAGTTSGTSVQAYTPNGTDAQQWKIVQKSGGEYAPDYSRPVQLVPKVNESLRLDCQWGGKDNGTAIQLWEANGSAAQDWQILDHGDGTWTLVNVNSSQALDVAGGGN